MNEISIDDILRRQLEQYQLFQRQLAENRGRTAPRPAPVITLSHMAGCCSRDLARLLADRLGCQVWDPELIDLAARDLRLRQEVASVLEADVLERVDTEVQDMVDRRRCRDDDVTVAVVRTIRVLAETGGVILQGRGAAFVLGDQADARLRLVARTGHRLAQIMQAEGVDARQAGVLMRADDSRRSAFVRLHFHADADDSRRYDLVLNTERLDPDAAADLVELYLERCRRD